jgi:eukaryotic-like serine/threonine-protein kinase
MLGAMSSKAGEPNDAAATPPRERRIAEGLAETAVATVSRTADDIPFRGSGSELPGRLPPGTAVGRYIVRDFIGSGGMGAVYAAHDHSLDRHVALKLVHEARRTPAGHERLVREARALARLSHPNVVAVYEIGSHEDELFVAMELVEGSSLREWLDTPRSWREIVSVFRRAGDGLAAAHDAGIIHRDVKPENLLIDRRGAVWVGDFGLAMIRTDAQPVAETATGAPALRAREGLTATGAVVGTPAYMAPEQLAGASAIDARADQFAFCVALYEALHGERPFAGTCETELAASIAEGRVVAPQRPRKVPSWLDRAILRGLAAQPEARYPSMHALLAAIGRDPRATALRWSIAGIALAAVAGVGVGISRMAPDPDPPCRDAEQHLLGVWDPMRQVAIEHAFLASGAPARFDTWLQVKRVLDDKTRALTAMRTEACEATQVRGEQSPAILDLRMECLDTHLAELRALTDLFLAADAKTVGTAARASRDLDGPEACANTAALRDRGRAATDPLAADRRDRLARLRALVLAGKDAAALELGSALATDATRAGDQVVEATTQALIGRTLFRQRDLPGAEAALYRAIASGQAAHDHRVAAETWINLVVLATDRVRYEDAHKNAVVAGGALKQLGGDRVLEARLAESLGVLAQREGKLAEARTELSRAVALLEQQFGRDHYRTATPLQRLAGIARSAGAADEAVTLSRRARAGLEKELGPDAPDVLTLRVAETGALVDAGRNDEALALIQATLASAERSRLTDRRLIAMLHTNTAIVYRVKGRNLDARTELERAISIHIETSGAETLEVAKARFDLAIVLLELKRTDDALAELARALAIQEKLLGPDHPALAMALGLTGSVRVMNGDPARGLAPLERAVALRTRASQPCDPNICYWLARALVATGGDRARARTLRTEAHAAFVAAGSPGAIADLDQTVVEAVRRR